MMSKTLPAPRAWVIPACLRPERTVLTLAILCAVLFWPACLYVGLQTIRTRHLLEKVLRLQPGATRAEVTRLIGSPTTISSNQRVWTYKAHVPELLQLPFIGPDDIVLEFSDDGRFRKRHDFFD